ncbi:MAG: LysE family translocator [Betaproteobacteria bacterium]|nr:LysE family translocator [Betaproteobacteria bacterium]
MLDILALASYAFVMSITPGPNNIMVTASGATFGYRATIPHLLGISLGFAFQALLMCLGLGIVFELYPVLHTILKWIGFAYLVYLGWKLLWAGTAGVAQVKRPLSFMQAALFQFVNPKAWIMAVTTATLFLPKAAVTATTYAAIFMILVVVNYPCITVWALFGSGMRRWLTNDRRRRQFNFLMSGMLLATAIMILT